MGQDPLAILVKLSIFFVPFLFSLCFHEFAHGWVAKLRGDRTAEMMGRLTLNPFAHADWIGTFLLPISSILFNLPIFFGWAKPVPVNPRNLKSPKSDMFWVALAGPMSNILLALVGSFVLAVVAVSLGGASSVKSIVEILKIFITSNLFLAFFNLIPLHPLDGGKVIARFLPPDLAYKLEQNEMVTSWILLLLIVSGALKILSGPVYMTAEFFVGLALKVVA